MARLPRTPAEAVRELGVEAGQRVLAFAPAAGYAEALAQAVGAEGRVVVHEPPPEVEPAPNLEVVESVPEQARGDVVLVWVGAVPAHRVREFPARVADGGVLWTVLPRGTRELPAPVHEAEVRRALLVAGWREDRVVPLSTTAYAIRFRRRR